ncbi:MAG: hypothetical protein ACRDTJ_21625 [Pseudonocardiaceae bacterium]
MNSLLAHRLLAELPCTLVAVGAAAAAQIVGGIVATTGPVTLIFSNTFVAIATVLVAPFTLAQLVGLVVGVLLILALYPDASDRADDVVVPHSNF